MTIDKEKTCCLCNEKFTGWGNNPEPLKTEGECCGVCDQTKVIPARINLYLKKGNV